jgi:8-oxo-dGTP pyrophosphatase MutT (NUDIX family)
MPTHAAEVSFPGGHFDSVSDATLMDTALREMREELLRPKDQDNDHHHSSSSSHHKEVNRRRRRSSSSSSSPSLYPEIDYDYPWHEIQVVGQTTTIPSIRGTPVTAVLAVLPHEFDTVDELDTIFPGNPHEVETVFTVSLDELLQVETMQQSDRFQGDIPAYPVEMVKGGRGPSQLIWGLTAVIVKPILHQLLQPVFFGGVSLEKQQLQQQQQQTRKFQKEKKKTVTLPSWSKL